MRALSLRLSLAVVVAAAVAGCAEDEPANPFVTALNEPVDYARVTAENLTAHVDAVVSQASEQAAAIEAEESVTFESIIRPFDAMVSELAKAGNNSWTMYWVSPDSATRAAGFTAFQRVDSLNTALLSRKGLYDKVAAVAESGEMRAVPAKYVEDLLVAMRQTGVDLSPEDLVRFKALRVELNDLSMQFATNMNTDIPVLEVDEAGAAGIPDGIKSAYAVEGGGYAIPVMPATSPPVLGNAEVEETRRRYYMANYTRAAEANLPILDQLIAKRHELGLLMGASSYAEYYLRPHMAKDPATVWAFLEDLIERTGEKARADVATLQQLQASLAGGSAGASIEPWNAVYLRNELLTTRFAVDAEAIREYLPLEAALAGMMDLYQELLGVEFRQVINPSVWHEEVTAYEVFDGGRRVGMFYLDLYPRPNKESWFYGMPLTPGRTTPDGYEFPASMLLGNFTRATDDRPSLVTHGELSTLFHEFGHIVNGLSYHGEFAGQSGPLPDFQEAMSQIFENWIWDYDVLRTFARHYESGEVLPRETFDNMLAAKTVTSGVDAQQQLTLAVYDLMLYDRYDPAAPHDTDELWLEIADRFAYAPHVEGTHRQASWIHINTHPVYYYGYIWSAVYSADMFTQFEANGMRDTETGRRYREIILANGTQRPIEETVEDFLGRPMSSEAYIRSLGLGRN